MRLYPSSHKLSQATANPQAIRAIFEIAGVDLLCIQYFSAPKSHIPEFLGQFGGTEVQLKGLARSRDPPGYRAQGKPLAQVE